MTLMAGPIDTRINPTKVNALAKKRSIEWFERALTAAVPLRYPGAYRRVYPGFVQLVAFMSMNWSGISKPIASFTNILPTAI